MRREYFLPLLVILIIASSGCTNSSSQTKIQEGTSKAAETVKNVTDIIKTEIDTHISKLILYKNQWAVKAAARIRELPELRADIKAEDVGTVLEAFNKLIQILNEEGGTDLQDLSVSKSDIEAVKRFINKHGPLMGPYNNLREAAIAVDETNQASIDEFYKRALIFTGDVFILQSNLIYKGTYELVGTIAFKAGAARYIAFCRGQCLTFVLGEMYWAIRAAANEALVNPSSIPSKEDVVKGFNETSEEGIKLIHEIVSYVVQPLNQ